jgi:hypothetical protein
MAFFRDTNGRVDATREEACSFLRESSTNRRVSVNSTREEALDFFRETYTGSRSGVHVNEVEKEANTYQQWKLSTKASIVSPTFMPNTHHATFTPSSGSFPAHHIRCVSITGGMPMLPFSTHCN